MNFALIMLLLLLLTGGIWLLDVLLLRKRRGVDAPEPWWIEYPKSFFPVILIVFLLRSFLVEPFKIPSGSMIPTLLVGDFILVNKYTYGIRVPILNTKLIEVSQPERGDVMVFRYPENTSLDYIKRVVGLPGDRVTYRDKRLYINERLVPQEADGVYSYLESGLHLVQVQRYLEKLGNHDHSIIVNPEAPALQLGGVRQFQFRENCVYNRSELSCVVPPSHYFVMGDNRDSSSDSRYWGFVPDSYLVGKAFMIWWNFSQLGRIGHSIR